MTKNFRINQQAIYLLFTIVFVLIGIILLFFLPIKIPYSIKTKCKIIPIKEWTLSKSQNGQLISILQDNVSGMIETYSVTQFEQDNATKFNLYPSIKANVSVTLGDTIALIYSNEIEYELVQLKGELSNEIAQLKLYKSGEKASIIKEAKERVTYVEEQLKEQNRVLEQQQALYEQDLISKDEFEIIKNSVRLFEINLNIAQSQLRTFQTGAKKEQIELTTLHIQNLQKEIDILQKKFEHFTLTSPLSGVVFRNFTKDTLLTIIDTTNYIAIIPIRLKERNYIANGQNVKLRIDDINSIMDGKLIELGKSIHILNGKQILFAIAIVEPDNENIILGSYAHCLIFCEQITLIEYLLRALRDNFII